MNKLFLVLAFLTLSLVTNAQSGTTGTLTWALSGSGSNRTLTIMGNGIMPNYTHGSTPWDSYRNSIVAVVIGNGVTSIGNYAFSTYTRLTSVIIGNSVTSIGDNAFGSCSFQTINIPNSVTNIGNSAFVGCDSLTSIIIPDSVTTIGQSAFAICSNLTSITIGEGVKTIGNWAFNGLPTLNTINFNAVNFLTTGTTWYWNIPVVDGITLNIGNKVQTIPDNVFTGMPLKGVLNIPNSVTSIGNGAFGGCNSLTSVTILNGIIGAYAFSSCDSLTSVIIGNDVTSIGSSAFSSCSSLDTLIIGNSVTNIGDYSFGNCTSLISVIIPNSLKSIGNGTFSSCGSLTSIIIGDSVTSIGNGVFSYCNNLQTVNYNAINCTSMNSVFYGCTALTTLHVGNQVKTIPDYAFQNCSGLTSVNIGNSVTSIGNATFYGCSNLDSITIPNSVTSIGVGAFQFCNNLASVTIGNSITSIEDYVFWGCNSLDSIIIPNSVTNIGNYAFYDCSNLTSVTIGNNVDSIGVCAFCSCIGLTSIISKAITPPLLGDYVFYSVPANIPVYIPCASYNNYTSDTSWNYFSNFVIDSTTSKADTILYNASMCYKTPYTDKFFTVPINSAGTYYITLSNSTSCDSVMCLILAEYPSVPLTIYDTTLCFGEAYNDNNFTNLTTAGIYRDTLPNVNGCDSIIELTLNYYPSATIHNYSDTICENGTYSDIYFSNLTLADTYKDTLKSIHGCDSLIINFTLHHYPSVAIHYYSASFCQGGIYNDDNFTDIAQAGVYYDTLKNVNGCDSIIKLTLTVDFVYFTKISDSIFAGGSYNFFGKTLTSGGIYYDTLQTIFGCDSIIELTLTVTSVGIVGANGIRPEIRVYPNPAKNELIVEIAGQARNDGNVIEIYDVVGCNVGAGLKPAPTNAGNGIVIDIAHLATGIYFLKIDKHVIKFVKE